jgi:hypothetical protein
MGIALTYSHATGFSLHVVLRVRRKAPGQRIPARLPRPPVFFQQFNIHNNHNTHMKIHPSLLIALLSLAADVLTASAQVTLTGTQYTETFNAIGSGLPPGWSVRTNATGTNLGTSATVTLAATSWATATGQFANFASTLSNSGTNFLGTEAVTNQAACTNRCLGIRQTGSFGNPGAAFVLQLQNTLGFADLQLSLDCNLLNVQDKSTVWTIDCGVGSNPGSFTALDTFADPGVFGATTKTVSLGSARDNLDQNVWIRVVARSAATGTNKCDTFGIDNVKLSYRASGTVAPIPLGIESSGGKVVLSWTNSSFALQAAPAAAGTYTNVPGATSPYTNSITGSQAYFRLKAN